MKEAIDNFLAGRRLAVVGVSRDKNKFANLAYRELKKVGYQVYPVSLTADEVVDDRCYPSLRVLPEPVDGLLVSVRPSQAEAVVRECASLGIQRVWLQQGSESAEAIRFCRENGISVVHNLCVLMFVPGVAFYHRWHGWFWKVFGKMPK